MADADGRRPSAAALLARFHGALATVEHTFAFTRPGAHDTDRHMQVLQQAVEAQTAHRLHAAWPGAKLRMIPDAGHGALETGIARALVAATEQFKRNKRFDS